MIYDGEEGGVRREGHRGNSAEAHRGGGMWRLLEAGKGWETASSLRPAAWSAALPHLILAPGDLRRLLTCRTVR